MKRMNLLLASVLVSVIMAGCGSTDTSDVVESVPEETTEYTEEESTTVVPEISNGKTVAKVGEPMAITIRLDSNPDYLGLANVTIDEFGTCYDDVYENSLLYLTITVDNIGDDDVEFSTYDFSIYNNDISMKVASASPAIEDAYGQSLSAKVSSGRSSKGTVYVNVPNGTELTDVDVEIAGFVCNLNEANTSENNNATESTNDETVDYTAYTETISDSENDSTENMYALYDMDNNGVKELFVQYSSGVEVYTIENNEVVYIDSFMTTIDEVYTIINGAGVDYYYSDGTLQTITRATLDGTTINSEELVSTESDEWVMPEGGPLVTFSVTDSTELNQ